MVGREKRHAEEVILALPWTQWTMSGTRLGNVVGRGRREGAVGSPGGGRTQLSLSDCQLWTGHIRGEHGREVTGGD